MKRTAIALTLFILASSSAYCAAGEEFLLGQKFCNVPGIVNTAQKMGIAAQNTNEMFGEMRPYIVVNNFLRIGGLLSGGYTRIKGTPNPAIIRLNEAGTGFGDIRFGMLAELYAPCHRWDRAIGVDFGYGGLITFVQDSNCSNDGKRVFYYFLRPQVSIGYNLSNSISLQISTGYNFTFPIDNDEMWFVDEAGDTLRNTFDADGMKGIFIRAGIVLGSTNNIREIECEKTYRPKPKPKMKPFGKQ